jgi:uncharacterized protein YhfF
MVVGNIPTRVRPFWEKFCTASATSPSETSYEVFYFGDTESVANELAKLVLEGIKRATASLLWRYEFENQPLPEAGNLSVMTNWDGIPLCVIQTMKVEILPFEAVPAEFARIEGEGDKTLEYWRDVHWRFFASECAQIGKTASPEMPVVCEQFSVVYQPGGNAA